MPRSKSRNAHVVPPARERSASPRSKAQISQHAQLQVSGAKLRHVFEKVSPKRRSSSRWPAKPKPKSIKKVKAKPKKVRAKSIKKVKAKSVKAKSVKAKSVKAKSIKKVKAKSIKKVGKTSRKR